MLRHTVVIYFCLLQISLEHESLEYIRSFVKEFPESHSDSMTSARGYSFEQWCQRVKSYKSAQRSQEDIEVIKFTYYAFLLRIVNMFIKQTI
jgi:hypothetical protein